MRERPELALASGSPIRKEDTCPNIADAHCGLVAVRRDAWPTLSQLKSFSLQGMKQGWGPRGKEKGKRNIKKPGRAPTELPLRQRRLLAVSPDLGICETRLAVSRVPSDQVSFSGLRPVMRLLLPGGEGMLRGAMLAVQRKTAVPSTHIRPLELRF